MSQNELSGCGQTHDASSHDGHIISAERQTVGEITDGSHYAWLHVNNWPHRLQKVKQKYLDPGSNVHLYTSVSTSHRPLKLISKKTHDTSGVVNRLMVTTKTDCYHTDSPHAATGQKMSAITDL